MGRVGNPSQGPTASEQWRQDVNQVRLAPEPFSYPLRMIASQK